MSQPKRQSDCHPDRVHCAKGMCHLCYAAMRQRKYLTKPGKVEENRVRANAWGKLNRDKTKENHKRWRENNREKLQQINRDHREANKEALAIKQLEYRRREKDKINAKARDYYYKEHEAHRAYQWKRIATKKKVSDGTVTKEFIAELLNQENCFYCQQAVEYQLREIEHKTPLSRGGLHSSINIVMACRTCNRTKNARTAEEFMSKSA